ncbi:hypothetical protein [Hymenobacter terricola]|uniref:hypothetical protein n=1 Tax=Hymenobacter terricola TaxID=2819236 RepID=UPI001B312FC0|nr:hypothetical protein [Hymenobacter terricola]
MKNSLIFRLGLVLLFVSISPLAHAQTLPVSTAPAGYWNVETNLTTHNYSIVRFYNGQDQLVYEERLDNLCLDMARRGPCRRATRQLNLALQQVLRDPATGQSNAVLAQQFGQHRHMQRLYAAR